VIVGFAPASVLASLSFADVLDEQTGKGYQRRFSASHSLDFRRYIKQPKSSTIPLTFNLRSGAKGAWSIVRRSAGLVEVRFAQDGGRVLSQVDCQHRLGHVGDLSVSLPFMIFVGLTQREELEIFSVINSKARGLSSSLLDLHEARLVEDLSAEKPELLIALHLNESDRSPWYKQLDLGGTATSGMKRRASLRTMQKAVRRFLMASEALRDYSAQEIAESTLCYWRAVRTVLDLQWELPRKHFLTKGIGVYALMGLFADLWIELRPSELPPQEQRLTALLADFATKIDWSSSGPLRGLGGEAGAKEALTMLRSLRARTAAHAAHSSAEA
jgi:DGQHR domain-containing protein